MTNHVRLKIIDKLISFEEKYNIRIIGAVEAGSRTWEYDSPDSDYDVRFIYVRPVLDYLKVHPYDETITVKVDDIDFVGWDIRKLLQHLYKSNMTVFEWFNSSIIYCNSEEFQVLRDFSLDYFVAKRGIYHYLGIAFNEYKRLLNTNTDTANAKQYLSILKALFSAKHIKDFNTIPPVSFVELMNENIDIIDNVRPFLLAKRTGNTGILLDRVHIDTYIIENLTQIKQYVDNLTDTHRNDWTKIDEFIEKYVMN